MEKEGTGQMTGNPFVRLGERMKMWLRRVVTRDFGNVSDAKGLYNILVLYEKYVPAEAKRKLKGGGKRLPYKRWT